jgi:hypothetical protein
MFWLESSINLMEVRVEKPRFGATKKAKVFRSVPHDTERQK